jgi:hypothetical protein
MLDTNPGVRPRSTSLIPQVAVKVGNSRFSVVLERHSEPVVDPVCSLFLSRNFLPSVIYLIVNKLLSLSLSLSISINFSLSLSLSP